MMATQARGGKRKNPMPTVIVVEGAQAKALRASIRAGAGRTHSPPGGQTARLTCPCRSHSRGRSCVERAARAIESPLFATLLDAALVAIDAK